MGIETNFFGSKVMAAIDDADDMMVEDNRDGMSEVRTVLEHH